MKVFLSYRRADTSADVGRFGDKLRSRLSSEHIFLDVESIESGEDFERSILCALSEADWVIVFIGQHWQLGGIEHASRLHEPDDYVRREIETALQGNKKVLPVLINDARMPTAEMLPVSIGDFAKRNAVRLRHASFHEDADKIIATILPSGQQARADACTFPLGLIGDKHIHTATAGAGSLHQFADAPGLPSLVLIPSGSLIRSGKEIIFSNPFAVGQAPLSVGEFDAFVRKTNHVCGGGCNFWNKTHWSFAPSASYLSPGFQQSEAHPVVCVSWQDAKSYTAWISRMTGEEYRLCSEPEWEYAARAGVRSNVWWRDGQGSNYAHCRSFHTRDEGTISNAMLAPNAWGLRHALGNVLEWTEDTWTSDLTKIPPLTIPYEYGSRTQRVVRGGAWNLEQSAVTLDYRAPMEADQRYNNTGFRLLREVRSN